MSHFTSIIENFSGKHKNKINKLCEPLFNSFGINYFFHQGLTRDGYLYCIGSHLDLMLHYADLKLYECNPFLTRFQELDTGTYLYDSVNDSDFQDSMRLLEKKYNTKHSCIIMEKDAYRCNEYGFTIPSNCKQTESLLINQKPLLKRFIQYFESEMSAILKEIRNNPISLPEVMGPSFFQIKSNVPKIHLEDSAKINFLSEIEL